ncbi:unnamed protein product [Cochlearia groenlandica]
MFPVTAVLHRLRHLRRRPRHSSTSASSPPPHSFNLPLNHPSYMVWSANTSLGKTLVSTGIAASFLLQPPPPSSSSSVHTTKLLYLKPIQTGFPSDSDSRFVFSKLDSLSLRRQIPLSLSNAVLRASLPAAASESPGSNVEIGMRDLNFTEEKTVIGAPELLCKTMYAWEAAISPHLAAEREKAPVEDSAVLRMLEKCFEEECGSSRSNVMCLVETAGGVASPAPSGTLQCDLYR